VDVHANPDEGPDDGTGVAAAAQALGPVWTGPGTDQLQVEVEAGEGSALHLEALRTADGPERAVLPTVSLAGGPAAPQILSTDAWGSPGWSYDTPGCSSGPQAAPLQIAVVHHTVTTNAYSASEADDIIRAIYHGHLRNEWCDIAYNFLVDRFGRIWQGRSGAANAPVLGGHARGFNTGSVGIALLGQHQPGIDPAATAPTAAQLDAVAEIVAWKFTLHGLDPTSSTTYEVRTTGDRFTEGEEVPMPRIVGHRNVGSTSCPGELAYPQLGVIRARAKAQWALPRDFGYGSWSDVPIWGDWDGDGRADPGVRRGNTYLLRFGASGGGADVVVTLGRHSDQVLVGDWDGDGVDTIGIYRDGNVFLTDANVARPPVVRTFRYGTWGDQGISGDWDGDGVDGIGVRRGNEWLLRHSPSGGTAQVAFTFGRHSDSPLTGDWDGDGRDTVGVWRDGTAHLAARNTGAPHTAVQPVPALPSRVIAGDPTGQGFDMVGRVVGNVWSPWYRMEAAL
jgi:hypothetical protein